jgi:predicted RNase H-like HicB family nuclease
MRYGIASLKTDEGYSVSVRRLPCCWSQGTTEEEALQNIHAAIQEYMAVRDDLLEGAVVHEVEVTR